MTFCAPHMDGEKGAIITLSFAPLAFKGAVSETVIHRVRDCNSSATSHPTACAKRQWILTSRMTVQEFLVLGIDILST